MVLDPVPDNYPFMNAEAIAATKARHPTTHQPAPRSRRPGENTARRPGENTARHPGEDR